VSLDPCSNTSGGTGYLYIVDALTGAGPTEAYPGHQRRRQTWTLPTTWVSGLEGKADGRNVTLEVEQERFPHHLRPTSAAARQAAP
jgi:hypothetical protein